MTSSSSDRAEVLPFGYRLVAGLSRFLLHLFYERIDVVGADNIPTHAPLVVAANHHNSLVDAMMLVALFPRRLRTLANAPLFKNPLIGPFLKVMGGLPVHRRQEAGNDPARNAALFAETTATLRAGGAIMLFPEGRTQPEPVLLELRTGAARMLLAAEAGGPMADPVVLLPVGLVFQSPGVFREGRALVLVGEPVVTRDAVAQAQAEPETAARQLTDRLASALRGLIVEAGDRETLGQLMFVEDLWSEAFSPSPADPEARVTWLQRVMRIYRSLQQRYPAQVASLRERLSACAHEMEVSGIESGQLSQTPRSGSFLREALVLAITAPFALAGIAAHFIPYKLTGAIVARILKDDEEEATDKIAVGFVFFPLLWLIEALLVFKLAGWVAALAFVLLLFPMGIVAVVWTERVRQAARARRSVQARQSDPARWERLREQRQALVRDLAELAQLAPEATAQ